jgi:hypothetical protein
MPGIRQDKGSAHRSQLTAHCSSLTAQKKQAAQREARAARSAKSSGNLNYFFRICKLLTLYLLSLPGFQGLTASVSGLWQAHELGEVPTRHADYV